MSKGLGKTQRRIIEHLMQCKEDTIPNLACVAYQQPTDRGYLMPLDAEYHATYEAVRRLEKRGILTVKREINGKWPALRMTIYPSGRTVCRGHPLVSIKNR